MVAKISERNQKWIKFRLWLHLILAILTILHVLFYCVYWAVNTPFIPPVETFIAQITRLDLPYILILLSLSGLVGIWSMVRWIVFRVRMRKPVWNKSHTNWLYPIFTSIFLLIFYLSLFMIIQQDPSQKGVLIHLLKIIRVVTDAACLLILAWFLQRFVQNLRKVETEKLNWLRISGIAFCLLVFVAIWAIPLVFMPSWDYRGEIPAKPGLLAHRGASMLAPENSLAAVELAADFGALAFETDVRISLDGVPFLMHDATLQRTTNINEIYPERAADRAENFTMYELKNLNAGWWFILNDPYGTIKAGHISQSQLSINQSQTIPTLEETLEMIKAKDLILMYDLRLPPADHPYFINTFEIVYDTLKAADMDENIWLLLDETQIGRIMLETPGIKRVIGLSATRLPDPSDINSNNFQVVNIDQGISDQAIKAYRNAGLAVNIYVIDQPWLFSQYWLQGVNSITTNNIQTLSTLNAPKLSLSYPLYLLFWSLFGLVLALWTFSIPATRKEVKPFTPSLEAADLVKPHEEPEQLVTKIESEFPSLEDIQAGEQTSDSEKEFPSQDELMDENNQKQVEKNPIIEEDEQEP